MEENEERRLGLHQMAELPPLFELATKTVADIIQIKKNNEDFTEYVAEMVQYLQDVSMKYSPPEQQTAGGAIIIGSKLILPSTNTQEKLILAPLYHHALDLVSNFDNIPSFQWRHVHPIFKFYLDALPRDTPGAIKILKLLIKIQDVLGKSNKMNSEFFDFENVLLLSRLITCQLEIVKNVDCDVSLRKFALESLAKVVRYCPGKKAPTVGLVVSGILGGLLRVTKGSSVNTELLENTIILFGDVIVLVFGNESVKFDMNEINLDDYNSHLHFLFKEQNDEWRKKALCTIHDYVRDILSSYSGHRISSVKWNVCNMVCRIQTECSAFLGSTLYDCIIHMYTNFRFDDNQVYQDLAQKCLNLITEPRIIQEYFYKQLNTIVRKIPVETRAGRGDAELKTLAAILDGLGEAVSLQCKTGSQTMVDILGCLADSLIIDRKGLLITSEGISDSLEKELRKFKLQYRVNHKNVKLICELLVRLGKFDIIDMVHNLLKEDSPGRKATYHIILAYMLNSLEITNDDESFDDPVILMLAEYLVQELNESCQLVRRDDGHVESSSYENDWHTCIECLSCTNVALCMRFITGDAHRSNVSINCLCAILFQSSSNTWVVSESANFALRLITENDKNVTDVSELVQAYSSHILHTVSLACSSSEDYLLAPQLLQGYMKFAEIGNNFDHFKVIIEKMLYALDTNEQEFTQSILRALFSFMAALCRQYEDLLPYEPPEDAEDQKEIATPQHIITEKVLLRTKQMLLSPHLPIRISCLEILAKGLELLKNYDDALLPMIHQNWHGIMTIVKENEPMSMAEAFEVVVVMSKRSGTFVHGKVLNEFLPKINGYLINIVKKEFIFQHTADYRLVVKVISQIAELIINLQLKEEEANDSFIAFLDLAISENRHFAILSAQQKEKIVEHFRKNLGASVDE